MFSGFFKIEQTLRTALRRVVARWSVATISLDWSRWWLDAHGRASHSHLLFALSLLTALINFLSLLFEQSVYIPRATDPLYELDNESFFRVYSLTKN